MNKKIYTANEFLAAISSQTSKILEIQTSILLPYSVTLPPGMSLH